MLKSLLEGVAGVKYFNYWYRLNKTETESAIFVILVNSSEYRLYFLVLRDHLVCLSYIENRVPLKPVLGGVASVAHFNTGIYGLN